ncbi:hypothetical protein EV126DRAFT_119962 [Verticillium dahliae]|nr:hypothetical protein EV126DRAFT_119962 [Verticillium dahliae]
MAFRLSTFLTLCSLFPSRIAPAPAKICLFALLQQHAGPRPRHSVVLEGSCSYCARRSMNRHPHVTTPSNPAGPGRPNTLRIEFAYLNFQVIVVSTTTTNRHHFPISMLRAVLSWVALYCNRTTTPDIRFFHFDSALASHSDE